MAEEVSALLASVLGRAREVGFLGPGPVDRHVRHGHGFSRVLAGWMGAGSLDHPIEVPGSSGSRETRAGGVAAASWQLVDLGAGGGVPGLVIALDLPEVEVVLLEASSRRADLLADAVERCGLGGRVRVVCERAEETGRDPAHRGQFDAVVARSFGGPAVTAECAAPLLRTGGVLVTSEPPGGGRAEGGEAGGNGPPVRWPAEGLAGLGMAPLGLVLDEFAYEVVVQREPCPQRFPRRTGVPGKRPLF